MKKKELEAALAAAKAAGRGEALNERRHNGWANYETWVVHLWMTNEEGSYRATIDQARETLRTATDRGVGLTKQEQAAADLACLLKDDYEEAMTDTLKRAKATCSVWADLLGAALSEVNWHEIAAAFLEEINP